ncbi:hypothetical protein OG373_05330 [Streptomyces avidinii]|uniref:hypothetical protein n=1 Tax=Streptomyces avidinii TaxID=1895 RepID=UPI00386E26DD|nr:hypothetical protein OG373_05330 [Streptomyces avidinii]
MLAIRSTIYGHCAVVLSAAAALTVPRPDVPLLFTAIAVPVFTAIAVPGFLIPVWYRAAVSATDEWSAAVRALVNTGRKPLAESLGLHLPGHVAAECEMWALVSKVSRLDPFRAKPPESSPS